MASTWIARAARVSSPRSPTKALARASYHFESSPAVSSERATRSGERTTTTAARSALAGIDEASRRELRSVVSRLMGASARANEIRVAEVGETSYLKNGAAEMVALSPPRVLPGWMKDDPFKK